MKNLRAAWVAALAALMMVGCQDLDTTNPNDPDMESVQQSPEDLETLISTSFVTFFERTQWLDGAITAEAISGRFGGGFFCYGVRERGRWDPVPLTIIEGGGHAFRDFPWRDWYRAIAAVNTGLQAIENADVVIRRGGEDVTPRAQAFAKFIQGVSHGYVALNYGHGYVYTENVLADTLGFSPERPQVQALLVPWPEVLDTALSALTQAIQIIDQHNVSIPQADAARWISGYSLSPEEFKSLIHTYQARFLAYSPRNRAEAEALDWNRVLNHLDQAWNQDFAPEGEPGIVASMYKHRMARQRSDVPSDHARPGYQALGFADQSDGFRTWWGTHWPDKQPFTMLGVQDRRIVGPQWNERWAAGEADWWEDRGLYYGHHVANVFAAERGTYNRSYYYFHRFGRDGNHERGPLVAISREELDILRAMALMWLGRPEEALPYVNRSRVENGGLEPVTLDGVPEDANGHCTPRKYDGSCGSLWDAVRWEFELETMGVDGFTGWWTRRSWDGLTAGRELHWSAPVRDQEILDLQPRVTHGGGEGDSAPGPAENMEQCPSAVSNLPRC